MGVVLAFSGLVGIAIPLMDHKYTILGFLVCWGSTLAICVLYFSEWRFFFTKFKKQQGYIRAADRRPIARGALISPIFAMIYFVAPILVYLGDDLPAAEQLVTQWGGDGPESFKIGDLSSYKGARASELLANGALIKKVVGSGYKLVVIAFHHSHSGDVQDEPNISISGPYDLEDGQIRILIPWNEVFFSERIAGFTPTGYELLAIPVGAEKKTFSTIREAIALGAKRLARRSGPP